MFPSYRNNQSVGLLCTSTDWFLYDGNISRLNVNKQWNQEKQSTVVRMFPVLSEKLSEKVSR